MKPNNTITSNLSRKAEGRGQRAEGRRDKSLLRMPEPSGRPKGAKGLRPPPNFQFGGSRLGGVRIPF